jgi:hypothetical protein
LLTRPVAALFAGFMFVAAFHVHMPNGLFWTSRGMEVPLCLMLICLDQLVGKIQERYGITREEAERQLADFERTHERV